MGKYTTEGRVVEECKIPRVPIQTPMFDERGLLTRTWVIFFERLKSCEISDIVAPAGAGELKATFGLLRPLTVEDDLTNHFICRTGGTFSNIALNAKIAPTGTPARLTIQKSVDEGVGWTNILASPAYIQLAIGDTSLQEYSNFVAAPANVIAPGNLLRINCIQKGSGVAGKNIEVVVRWEPEEPA